MRGDGRGRYIYAQELKGGGIVLDCLLVLAQRECLFRVVERVVYADSRLGLFLTVDEGVMKAKKDAMGNTYADMVVVEFKGLLLLYLSSTRLEMSINKAKSSRAAPFNF